MVTANYLGRDIHSFGCSLKCHHVSTLVLCLLKWSKRERFCVILLILFYLKSITNMFVFWNIMNSTPPQISWSWSMDVIFIFLNTECISYLSTNDLPSNISRNIWKGISHKGTKNLRLWWAMWASFTWRINHFPRFC